MLGKISRKKLAGVVIAGILTVTCTTTAFAADIPVGGKHFRPRLFNKVDSTKAADAVKTAMDSLVKAGTITQAQADAVTKAHTPGEARIFAGIEKKNPFDELVTSNTITQAQADAVMNAIKPEKISANTVKEALDSLVNTGTITQAQKTAITEALAEKTVRFMNRGRDKGFLNTLITEGTISQAQADTITSALTAGRNGKESMEAVLKNLVTKGTITQAQLEAIQKNSTPPEKRDFVKFRDNHLDELVNSKTITQAQADAINAAIKSAMDSLKNK